MSRHFSLAAAAFGALLSVAPPAFADQPALLSDEGYLSKLVWQHNPEVLQARALQAQSRADLMRATAWTNPGVSLGFSSIPFSSHVAANPGDQPVALDIAHAPAYTVDLTQPIDIWKRQLRIERATAGREIVAWQTRDLHKQRTADLLGVVVHLTAARVRAAVLAHQQVALGETARLIALSAREGVTAPLEREKIEIEQGRSQALVDQALVAYSGARADWARLTLEPAPDVSIESAEVTLARLATLPGQWPALESNLASFPQQRVLAQQSAQARADLEVARKGWLPDVELHLGYTHNTLAGNVPDSAQGGVNLAFPFWQRGEADAVDANGRLTAARLGTEAAARTFHQQEAALRDRAETLARLQTAMSRRLVGARATVSRLEGALRSHGIPLSDVIQVRRTVLDLEGDRVDLLEQLASTLVDYRRLTTWRLPDPEGATL